MSDICPNAIDVAQKNATKNQSEVQIRCGDFLEPYRGEKADFVVCNPPYISDKEIVELDTSVRNFEPLLALRGGKRGTEFFERLATELPNFLHSGAGIYLEIGSTQGENVKKIFSKAPWISCRLLQDWSSLDRFFFLQME